MKTMEEFAAASGLSRPTLSKYFTDPNSVRPTTRERVEAALRKLDYKPNLFAQNLNRRTPRIIGVVVPYTTDPFFAEVIRHIETRCLEAGFLAIVLSSHGDPELEARAIETLESLKIAGAIVAPLGFHSDVALVRRLGQAIPIVFLDSRLDETSPLVGTDNRQSIALIVEYLSRTGEQPCFLAMPMVNNNAVERSEAYRAAMLQLGLEPMIITPAGEPGWEFEEIGYREALGLLRNRGFPTRTVLCANDRLAFGVMAAAFQLGIPVSRGAQAPLRVAGHDDHPLSRYTCPPLTTVAQDFDRLGNLCVDSLLSRISEDRPAPAQRSLLLEARLVMRKSA